MPQEVHFRHLLPLLLFVPVAYSKAITNKRLLDSSFYDSVSKSLLSKQDTTMEKISTETKAIR